MSEIQRYMYARDGMVPDAEHLRGSGEPEFWVRFTDHEAERAENLATIDFLNKELRSAVDALADAKARIEDLHYGDDNLLIGTGYQLAVNDALAALTQPQTERCPEDCDGFGRLIGDSDGPCPACSGLESDGGGAATAADADLAEQVDDEWRGKVIDLADELDAEGKKDVAERVFALTLAFANTEPGPYAKAFREKFPVPEFPGIQNQQEGQA